MRSITGWVSLAGLLAATGCGGTGTDLNEVANVDPFSDAGADSAEAGGGTFQDPFAGAPAYAPQAGVDGHHNPGKSCTQSGCHGSVMPAEPFLIGGTVYKDYKGTTPAGGVEVRVVDAAGHALSVYTASTGNAVGNFYIASKSAGSLMLPLVVGARDGATTRPMITVLTDGMGTCAQSTCHVAGGGPASGSSNYYPIHVP